MMMWDKQPEVEHSIRKGKLVYDWHFYYMDTWFLISAPFVFNGLSIPVFCWLIIAFPFTSWATPAALIHDWFYGNHKSRAAYVWDGTEYREITRYEADRAFLQALVYEIKRRGGNRIKQARRMWRARAMYLAVRKVGGLHWS